MAPKSCTTGKKGKGKKESAREVTPPSRDLEWPALCSLQEQLEILIRHGVLPS